MRIRFVGKNRPKIMTLFNNSSPPSHRWPQLWRVPWHIHVLSSAHKQGSVHSCSTSTAAHACVVMLAIMGADWPRREVIDHSQNPPTLSYCCYARHTLPLSHYTYVLTQWKIHRRAKRKLTTHRQRRQSRLLLVWNKVSGPSAFKLCHF